MYKHNYETIISELHTLTEGFPESQVLTLDIDNFDAQETREIKDIVEWEVWTPSGWSDFKQVKKITKPYYYHLILEDNTELKASPYHKIKMIDGEFYYMLHLASGDVTFEGKIIKSNIKINESIDLYDLLEVEKNHEYYANGITNSNCSAISHLDEIWASAGLTLTKSNGHCIGISTPKGQNGWYYEQYTHAEENGWNIVEAHWSEHPDYSLGMYQYVKDPNHSDGGYVKHYNEGWPDVSNKTALIKYKTKETYPFVLDGRLRSPWYDYESKKLGVQKTRCELDCSFAGSGSEVFEPETIRALKQKAKLTLPIPNIQLGLQDKGPFKSYKQYKQYIPEHGYCISADVATGDGSDFSTAVVIDLTTKEVVATYKDQVETTLFAKVLVEIGRRFGSCVLIVEYQGPGISVLMELKNNLRYTNIYQHDLKRNEVTKPQRKKIGFWQGQSTRALGGDKTEEVLNTGEFTVYSLDFFTELETWIWDKDGKRRHAPGKNDDLIMAFSNAMFYIYHALERKKHNREMMKKHFGKQIIGSFNGQDMFDDEFKYGTGLS